MGLVELRVCGLGSRVQGTVYKGALKTPYSQLYFFKALNPGHFQEVQPQPPRQSTE